MSDKTINMLVKASLATVILGVEDRVALLAKLDAEDKARAGLLEKVIDGAATVLMANLSNHEHLVRELVGGDPDAYVQRLAHIIGTEVIAQKALGLHNEVSGFISTHKVEPLTEENVVRQVDEFVRWSDEKDQ